MDSASLSRQHGVVVQLADMIPSRRHARRTPAI